MPSCQIYNFETIIMSNGCHVSTGTQTIQHYGDAKWSSWRLELQVNRVLVQQFDQTNSKAKDQGSALLSFCEGKSTCDPWIPRTKDSNAENVSIPWRHNV